MPKETMYTLVHALGTRCPSCKTLLVLLCRKHNQEANPQFYICFFCNRIFEVGIGEVL